MHVNDKTYCLHCRHNKLGTRHGYDRKGGSLREEERGGGMRAWGGWKQVKSRPAVRESDEAHATASSKE